MKHLFLTVSIYITVLLSAFVTPLYGEGLSTLQTKDILKEANAFFKEGSDLPPSDRAKRDELYRKALLRYEQLINEAGIKNGAIYYNTANIYFLLGDLGRAILNYRRAELFAPTDDNILKNLEYVRNRKIDKINTTNSKSRLKTIFFWHYLLSKTTKVKIAIVFFALFWIFLTVRLLKLRSCSRIFPTLCALITILFLTSAFIYEESKAAVIIAPETIARKGDGLNYEPAFKDPLHAGTEVVIKEDRDNWLRVELPDGSSCWLLANDLEVI
jgi:tetratricopeptide (TPR) repeat protein